MGCHTWAYVKSNKQFTYQECKDMLLKVYKEDLKDRLLWESDLNKGLSIPKLFTKYNIDWCSEEDLKDFIDYIPILKRTIQFIEKGLCKEAVMVHAAPLFNILLPKDGFGNVPDSGFYYSRGDGFYIRTNEIHEIFRVRDYPYIELKSFKEAINYYYNNPTSYTYEWNKDTNKFDFFKAKEDIEMDTLVEEGLKQFFNNHPEGCLLTFG